MVLGHRYPVVMSLVQAATVPAIGLSWSSHSEVARLILTPLLIASFIVGVRSALLLRDRLGRRLTLVWRRRRYRATVIRPVHRGSVPDGATST
jgi:hypothetical protein